jgi:hypothetical protein
MNFFRTSYAGISNINIETERSSANLNGPDVGILSDVFVLVQSIFGRFALLQIDREFDEKEHNRLKGGNRTVA